MSLRVALVLNQLDVGGTETAVRRLALGARDLGLSPWVIAVRGLGSVGAKLGHDGIAVTNLALPGGLRAAPLRVGLAATRLGRALRARSVDLVQSFLFEGNAVARVAARAAHLPLIAGFRSNAFRLPAERLLERTTGDWVSAYTAVSDTTADQAATVLGIDRNRIETIYNGIEPVPQPSPPRRIQTLGFLGRLHWEKGLDDVLHALARMQPPRPRLEVAGDGPDRERLVALAAQLALSESVRFLGHVDHPETFLEHIDAVVVAAHHEGLSNAALEAMAHARPVVASDTGGNGELVEHGVTGFLFPARDVDALGHALGLLLSATDAGALGAAGHRRVRSHFGVETMLSQHRALWHRVARRPLL